MVTLSRLKVSDIKAVRHLSGNVNDCSLLIASRTGLILEDIDNIIDLVDY